MGKNMAARGALTVFFTLLSAIFISVFFVLLESVRFQGARAQTQHNTEMGMYSVFGEYEKKLLTDYEVFAVDGAYGSGDFSIRRVEDHYKNYMEKNASPNADGLASLCFDPWQVSLTDVSVKEYALLSDNGGEQFYQQVVGYMRKTAIMGITGKLVNYLKNAKDTEEKQAAYEKEKNSLDKELEELEKAREENEKKQKEANEGGGGQGGTDAQQENTALVPAQQLPAEQVKVKNPIPAIRKLRRKSILKITCGDQEISDAGVARKDLSSKRKLKSGDMKVPKRYGGVLNDLIFSEYLLGRFSCFTDKTKEGKLKYEIEYLLGGKTTDRKNLQAAITKVLLVRETANYLYASGDEVMSSETGALAAVLIGWTGIPALVALMKHALLLAWSYGESLLDVRGLMEGGKIALWKDSSTWKLKLENLAQINEILDKGGSKQGDGLNYRGYLRILLYLQNVSALKKRALDLVELRVAMGEGLSGFQVDHCVVGIKAETKWNIPALFSRVSAAFSGTGSAAGQMQVRSGFIYD